MDLIVNQTFDHIIVGGGAAGCVLANRLSADPARRVLLLEAGPPDRHPYIHMPRGVAKILSDPRHVWPFTARSRAGDNAPGAIWVRGRTLGGSSSVNGMMYVRGQPADFADLAAAAGNEWGWDEIGRIHGEIEDHPFGAAPTRGTGGALKVSFPRRHALMDALIAAGGQAGLEPQDDINTPDDRAKIGYCPSTIHRGRRQSAAVTFLDPVRSRKNLTIVTGVTVDRVLFDRLRAVGVEARRDGKSVRYAGQRIILACGTLASPALLQRSGIGPAELLARLGIPLIADRSEVGANLTEHCALAMQWRLKRPLSLNPQFSGWRLLINGIRYFGWRGGALATAAYDVLGWLSTTDSSRPDVQLIGAPFSIDKSRATLAMERQPGMQIAVYPLRPKSRGKVEVTSRDPDVLPEATLDFFADPDDRAAMIAGVRAVRGIMAQGAIAPVVGAEIRPGPAAASDDEILDACRAMATTAYHAAGTCRMGRDEQSVVDPLTRVRGVAGLHVADLSIAPSIPAGNTFAPVIAMAWRAAELIAGLDDGSGQAKEH